MNPILENQVSDQWHILKGETQYGPYSYSEMIKMMQTKMVFSFDYIWAPHMEAWTSLADVPEFSADRLSRLVEHNVHTEAFNRRDHERVLCKLPVYVNDNQRLWQGVAENLSEGGALVMMENPLLLPGEVIHLHFRNTPTLECFNASAEVLTKRLTKQRIQHDTGIHYAVKFLQIGSEGKTQIKKQILDWKQKKGA
jgi:hypothetical protein